jgi:glutamate carboxypeptidase
MEKLERSGRLVELTRALAAGLGFEVRDAATGGASDANTTAGLGVPSLDGLGPVGGMDHSPEEWLDVGSIVPRTALFAALLLATGRDPAVRAWRAAAREP